MHHHQQNHHQQNTEFHFNHQIIKPTYQQKKKSHLYPLSSQSYPNLNSQNQGPLYSALNLKSIAAFLAGKSLVILFYFLLSDFKLLDFIFVILLNSIDFWLNKNIHGNKLAGLRWWIELDQHSQDQDWIFESVGNDIQVNNINSGVFWITNLLIALFWFINLIICIFVTDTIFWVSLCIYCLGMAMINLLCFYKCHGNHKKKTQQFMQKMGLKSATNLLSRSEQQMTDQYQNSLNHEKDKFQIQ